MPDAGLSAYLPEQRGILTQVFALWGAPAAWFVELNVGYLLSAAPCFPADHRLVVPPPSLTWTHAGLLTLLALCIGTAFLSLWVAWSGPRAAAHTGPETSRQRFMTQWARALSVGFCLVTLASAVGIGLLPRCGG